MRGPGGMRGPGNITLSGSGGSQQQKARKTIGFSRPKELFTIASEVLSVAERLPKAAQREYWATQADSVFNQMKMEADMDVSRAAVNAARGRCWLVVGEARAEGIEVALERGEGMGGEGMGGMGGEGGMGVLHGPAAEDAREGLMMAVTFFERAKGGAKARYPYSSSHSSSRGQQHGHGSKGQHQHGQQGQDDELGPLLAEALLTLANVTADEGRREALYARAVAEDPEIELDPIEVDVDEDEGEGEGVGQGHGGQGAASASASASANGGSDNHNGTNGADRADGANGGTNTNGTHSADMNGAFTNDGGAHEFHRGGAHLQVPFEVSPGVFMARARTTTGTTGAGTETVGTGMGAGAGAEATNEDEDVRMDES